MTITKRVDKGSELTYEELDENFRDLDERPAPSVVEMIGSNATDADGGALTLNAGDAAGVSGNGGLIYISGGDSAGGSGGSVSITGGSSGSTGAQVSVGGGDLAGFTGAAVQIVTGQNGEQVYGPLNLVAGAISINSIPAVATQEVLVAGVGTLTFTHGLLTNFVPA